MTKTVCDICGCDARNQYTVPIWSDFETNGIGITFPRDTNIQLIKIDLCKKHEKEVADFIAMLLGSKYKGIERSYNVC